MKYPNQILIRGIGQNPFYISKISITSEYIPDMYYDILYKDSLGNFWWNTVKYNETINDLQDGTKWEVIPFHIVDMIQKEKIN